MEMNGDAEKPSFEVGVVVPKIGVKDKDSGHDCIDFLVLELERVGLIVDRVLGISDEFLKLAATLEALGRAATELQIKKLTYVGIDLQFEWDQSEAFVRQPDGSLFNWCERFRCFHHLIYGIVNKGDSAVTLTFDRKEFKWEIGESLLKRMECEGIVKQVFPLHDETKRKQLLRKWALNWMDFTWQPIDEVYAYFGMKPNLKLCHKVLPHLAPYHLSGRKLVPIRLLISAHGLDNIATYFSFLGMYTRWLFLPAGFGLILQLINFGSSQLLGLPIFFAFTISWAVLFLQFWKRKNSALLTRWHVSYAVGLETGYKVTDTGTNSFIQSSVELEKKPVIDKPKERDKAFQREEWFGQLLRFRNDTIVVLGIICLQLPFELAYAHSYEVADSDTMRFGLTAVYLLVIQYYTKICGKISVKLIKYERNGSTESSADSLVYKVFGLYFMQSYIGLFYHALVYRNFMTLRQVLIQRLIVSQVLENLLENSIPYLKYSYKKYRAVRKRKHEKGSSEGKAVQLAYRVEKEYMKPSYSASTGEELEDGLFDDFLELALQFGMIMMFACAFPLAFAFAVLNNITEIRTDALKLLVMLRRPIPRAAATIGAWLNIFQFLLVMSICTNCALLVCLYDEEGKWKIEPGLAAILIMEHVLLLIKFGFSHFVPECVVCPHLSCLSAWALAAWKPGWSGHHVAHACIKCGQLEPAWVKAKRVKNAAQAHEMCSKQLRNLYSLEKKKD